MIGVDVQPSAAPAKASPLRILAIHRYYWPDTPPYASMLREIVKQWIKDGHSVDVLSSQPSYKSEVDNTKRPARESLDGAAVLRLTLPTEAKRPIVRIVNALRLGVAILWHSFRQRYDVIMISTAPPVLGGVAASIAAKLFGARFIYHCMDIHPEVGQVSGEFSRPAVFKLLRRLDTFSCRQANPVVVLSNDMAATLRARPRAENLNIEVINNFELPSAGPKNDTVVKDKNRTMGLDSTEAEAQSKTTFNDDTQVGAENGSRKSVEANTSVKDVSALSTPSQSGSTPSPVDEVSASPTSPITGSTSFPNSKGVATESTEVDSLHLRNVGSASLLPFTIDPARLTILFAGNVGRFQGLDSVVDAMAQIKDRDDIEFIIMGEGTAKAELMAKANDHGGRITFVNHQPVHVAKLAMQQVSYGYVSLVPKMYCYAFPSKTMTYLAQACPLIVAVEKESELASEALQEHYGHWVPADDGSALAQLLVRLADDRDEQKSMAQNAQAKALRDFSKSVVLTRWNRLLQPVTAEAVS